MDRSDTKAGADPIGAGPSDCTEPDAAASAPTLDPRWTRRLARFLLPSACHACRAPLDEVFSGGVCAACWRALPEPDATRCLACDEPLPAAALPHCGRCLLDPPAFATLRAAAPYRGPARRILLAFKFGGADYLAPRLADILLARLGPAPAVDGIVAVPAFARFWPLAPRRAADLLAAAVSRRLHRPLARRLLRKCRPTRRQSGLPLARRFENVRGAYRACGPVPPRVLLIDDVATSCATARACAAALTKAGAREVVVWCFARASR